jgi:hypothetical protein
MAKYFAGLLAGGRTPSGRDDRAVAWAAMVSNMSALQVRAHFLLYREWALHLHSKEVHLGQGEARTSARMHVEMIDFMVTLGEGTSVHPGEAMNHAVVGLVRLGPLGDHFGIGKPDKLGYLRHESPYAEGAIIVEPTVAGIELYGCVQGVPVMNPATFLSEVDRTAVDEVPRLTSAAFPQLPTADG